MIVCLRIEGVYVFVLLCLCAFMCFLVVLQSHVVLIYRTVLTSCYYRHL